MSLPIVAIVGRPNVGKSSLFNWLANRRISIVDPTAGVTRDRVATIIEFHNRFFELMDTGGIGIVDVDDLTADVERQIQTAIDSAAVVVFVGCDWSSVWAQARPMPVTRATAVTAEVTVLRVDMRDSFNSGNRHLHRLSPL